MKNENKKSNDLHDFMVSATHEMQSEYERIQKSSKEDPGTAGDQGEENWAALFRDWLPPNYHIVTKGRMGLVNRTPATSGSIYQSPGSAAGR